MPTKRRITLLIVEESLKLRTTQKGCIFEERKSLEFVTLKCYLF